MFDGDQASCEASRSQRKAAGWEMCWYLDGRCRSLRAWDSEQVLGKVILDADVRGCTGKRLLFPRGMPTADAFLKGLSTSCGTVGGWKPIDDCASVLRRQQPCPLGNDGRTQCRSMTVIEGRRQCYSQEQNSNTTHMWKRVSLNAAHVCGAKKCDQYTETVVRSFLSYRLQLVNDTISRTSERKNSIKYLVVVDKACNGCGKSLAASSNLWHRMTRMFTAWEALKSIACGATFEGNCRDAPLPVADIVFTREILTYPYFSRASSTGWQNLAGGKILRPRKVQWDSYDELIILPYAPTLFEEGKFFDVYSKGNPDKLWSLATGRHLPCAASEAGDVWRSFVRDMLTRMQLRPMLWPAIYIHHEERATAQVCLLLRADTAKPAGRSDSWVRSQRTLPRYEAPGCVASMHDTISGICHGTTPLRPRQILFSHGTSLRTQVAQMADCRVAMGIHGAQLMNVMWMPPGTAVVEFHRLSPKVETGDMSYYYRNVALLSGLTYYSRRVCDNRTQADNRSQERHSKSKSPCAGFSTTHGIHLYPDIVEETVTAAVAAVGHAGGMYDDSPIRRCSHSNETSDRSGS